MWLLNIEYTFCCGIPLPYIDSKIATDYLMIAFSFNECVSKGNQAFLLIKWLLSILKGTLK